MAKNEQEIEVKFLIRDRAELERRLIALGAQRSSERVHEVNLRFDTPDGTLTREHRVLRLRQDAASVMTFKGPAQAGESVSVRQEIEFQVSSFEAARHLLEALGYIVAITYEKYRTTYYLHGLMVTLDEMPFGNFIEVEGTGAESIQAVARELGLDWNARSVASYLALFQLLCSVKNLSARNLTFDELRGVEALPGDMGLIYSDERQAG